MLPRSLYPLLCVEFLFVSCSCIKTDQICFSLADGLLLFVVSFGILQGPNAYLKHIFSAGRVVFTIVFFGSVLTTMYCAAILKSTILTILASVVEIFAILYYAFSYFPFGATTITWFTSYFVGYIGGVFAALF